MKELIKEVDISDIHIIIAIMIIIVIALIIIVIIENRYSLDDLKNSFKRRKKEEIDYFDNFEREQEDNRYEFEAIKEDYIQEEIYSEKEESYQEERVIEEIEEKIEQEESQEEHKKIPFNNIIKKQKEEEIVYVTAPKTQEEAKKAIEEAAKKLVYEEKPDIISPTFFEKVQEEQSIISYEELMHTNMYEVLEDNKEIMDEGDEPITLDEIYTNVKYEASQEESTPEEEIENEIPEENIEEAINRSTISDENNYDQKIRQVYSNTDDKFKPSDVISPVFGVKREVVYQKEYNEFGETINIKELEVEIKKTEEFLKELKKLKNKLD